MDWNNDDKRKMATIVSKVCELEKAYGMPEKDSKSICRALEMWLGEDFTAAQVVYAIERLVKKSVKVPMPDEIRAFLSPEDRKVTVAEYNQALKDYANNGRDPFSPEGRIIKQYREQNEKEDRAIQERKKEIAALSDTRSLSAEMLSDEDLKAIEASKVPVEYAHLDKKFMEDSNLKKISLVVVQKTID